MHEPHLSCSLHLHDAPIELRWVPNPLEAAGGFIALQIHNLSVLVFNEDQAERILEAGSKMKQMFIDKRIAKQVEKEFINA